MLAYALFQKWKSQLLVLCHRLLRFLLPFFVYIMIFLLKRPGDKLFSISDSSRSLCIHVVCEVGVGGLSHYFPLLSTPLDFGLCSRS